MEATPRPRVARQLNVTESTPPNGGDALRYDYARYLRAYKRAVADSRYGLAVNPRGYHYVAAIPAHILGYGHDPVRVSLCLKVRILALREQPRAHDKRKRRNKKKQSSYQNSFRRFTSSRKFLCGRPYGQVFWHYFSSARG
jgi:hypothetical protein